MPLTEDAVYETRAADMVQQFKCEKELAIAVVMIADQFALTILEATLAGNTNRGRLMTDAYAVTMDLLSKHVKMDRLVFHSVAADALRRSFMDMRSEANDFLREQKDQ